MPHLLRAVALLPLWYGCGGAGASAPRPVSDPPPAPSASLIETMVMSQAGSCAVFQDATSRCWGSWGGALLKVSAPVAELAGVVDLAAGHDFLEEPQQRYHDHLCAVDRQGVVRCWGNGRQGQLGVEGDASPTPTVLEGLPAVTEVALGGQHSCALTRDGAVWCWGSNEHGQLGAGQGVASASRPRPVTGLPKATQVIAARFSTCALTEAGDVYCWGDNLGGESGAPNVGTPTVWSPRRVELSGPARQLSGAFSTLCALETSGQVACWGYVSEQLGPAFEKATSGHVPDLADVTRLSVGYSHSCALRDRELWCWGKDGAAADWSAPHRVPLPGAVVDVATGKRNTCARVADGRWFCWGENLRGEIGPVSVSRITEPRLLDLSQVALASQ